MGERSDRQCASESVLEGVSGCWRRLIGCVTGYVREKVRGYRSGCVSECVSECE